MMKHFKCVLINSHIPFINIIYKYVETKMFMNFVFPYSFVKIQLCIIKVVVSSCTLCSVYF